MIQLSGPNVFGTLNFVAARTYFVHAQEYVHERITRSRTLSPEEKARWTRRMAKALGSFSDMVKSGVIVDSYELKNAALNICFHALDRKMPLEDVEANVRFLEGLIRRGGMVPNPSAEPDAIDQWRRSEAGMESKTARRSRGRRGHVPQARRGQRSDREIGE